MSEALNSEVWFWPLLEYSTGYERSSVGMPKLGTRRGSVTEGLLVTQKRGWVSALAVQHSPLSTGVFSSEQIILLVQSSVWSHIEPCWGPTGGVLGNLGQAESWLISDCCGCRTSESSIPPGDLAECPAASQDTTCYLCLGIWFVHLVISSFFPLQAVSKYK